MWAVIELDRGRVCVELSTNSHDQLIVRDWSHGSKETAEAITAYASYELIGDELVLGRVGRDSPWAHSVVGATQCWTQVRIVAGERPSIGRSEVFATAEACRDDLDIATPLPADGRKDEPHLGGPVKFSCWAEVRNVMREYLEDARRPPPRLSDAQHKFLEVVARGLTIYKSNEKGLMAKEIAGLPPGCHPWIVRSKDFDSGMIERREKVGSTIVVRSLSYRFRLDRIGLSIEYPGEGWLRFDPNDLVHPTEIHGSPAGGPWYVDTRVRQPFGGIYPWFTSRKACEEDAAAQPD